MSETREQVMQEERLVAAAEHFDWTQVFLNRSPACFHLADDGRFCGRAVSWAGHPSHHGYVSIADVFKTLRAEVAALREDAARAGEGGR